MFLSYMASNYVISRSDRYICRHFALLHVFDLPHYHTNVLCEFSISFLTRLDYCELFYIDMITINLTF